MPSKSSKWYHLSTTEKKEPTVSGYSKRRRRRYLARQSSRSTSRRSHRSSENFRSVSSSEARRRFGKRGSLRNKK
jgi:hypothetical protein